MLNLLVKKTKGATNMYGGCALTGEGLASKAEKSVLLFYKESYSDEGKFGRERRLRNAQERSYKICS